MAVELATAYVQLVPSALGIESAIRRDMNGPIEAAAQQTSDNVGGIFKKMALVAGGAFAAIGAANLIKGTISAASDLNESVSKVNVVFGDSAGAVQDFAKTSAKSLGESRQQALEAIGTFGNLFTALKIGQKPAADMGIKLTSLAGDLASFNNVSPDDALIALRAGLVGETEPLRQFGVNMNDATLHAEALRLGLINNVKDALDPSVKAQAAYSLILAQTTTAQGDFARTSGGLANQQRILSAEFEDAKAKIGTALLPAVIAVTSALANNLGPAIDGVRSGFAFVSRNIDIIGPLLIGLAVAIAIPLVGAFIGWAVSAALAAAATIAAAAPVIAIGLAIALLVAGIIYAYQHWAIFREAVDLAAKVLREALAVAVDAAIVIIGVLVDYVKLIARVVGDVVGFVVAIFQGDWSTAWSKISDIPIAVIDFIRSGLDRFLDFIGGLGGRIGDLAGGMFDGIKSAFRSAINWIIDAWNGLQFKIPGFDPPGPGPKFGGFTLGVPNIPRLHAGGIVPGSPGSEVMAILQAGEQVIARADVADGAGTHKHYHLGPVYVQPGVDLQDQFERLVFLGG